MSAPVGLLLQKPQQRMEPGLFDRMVVEDVLTNMRKYNGFRAHVVTGAEDSRIWSRNWSIDYTPMFPHLAAEFKGAPEGLVIDAEMYVHGVDTTGAIQAAINGKGGDQQTRLAVFDMIDVNGALARMEQDRRFQLVQAFTAGTAPCVHRAQTCDAANYARMEDLIGVMGWEGVVAWDKRAQHRTTTGREVKRGESWKIKRTQTEDLVVTRIVGGAGPDMIGAVFHLSRFAEGKLVPAGKVGSWDKGFELAWARGKASDFVVEVRHYGIDERGNMEFPKILRARPDLAHEFGLAA